MFSGTGPYRAGAAHAPAYGTPLGGRRQPPKNASEGRLVGGAGPEGGRHLQWRSEGKVWAALRARGGPLQGLPRSHELQGRRGRDMG